MIQVKNKNKQKHFPLDTNYKEKKNYLGRKKKKAEINLTK